VASVKPSGSAARTGSVRFGPDSVTARNVTLTQLIVNGYGIRLYQIEGGPGWLDSERYDLDARADKPQSREKLKALLRTLLAQRFRLALRQEKRQVSGYALIVAKGGPHVYTLNDPKNKDNSKKTGFRLQLKMADLATGFISKELNSPVIDETGLEGVYDIVLSKMEERQPDMVSNWERMLEPLGLKLDARRKIPVDFLIVERAERASPNE
jgi:uncharacterized protein (TIGR03435 family)